MKKKILLNLAPLAVLIAGGIQAPETQPNPVEVIAQAKQQIDTYKKAAEYKKVLIVIRDLFDHASPETLKALNCPQIVAYFTTTFVEIEKLREATLKSASAKVKAIQSEVDTKIQEEEYRDAMVLISNLFHNPSPGTTEVLANKKINAFFVEKFKMADRLRRAAHEVMKAQAKKEQDLLKAQIFFCHPKFKRWKVHFPGYTLQKEIHPTNRTRAEQFSDALQIPTQYRNPKTSVKDSGAIEEFLVMQQGIIHDEKTTEQQKKHAYETWQRMRQLLYPDLEDDDLPK